MKKIVFYSVKGGTGRSLSLANVAYMLAKQGKKVACIDFDVLAPGLVSIFGISEDDIKGNLSVIDLLLKEERDITLLNSYIDCTPRLNLGEGAIYLLPARTESLEKYKKITSAQLWTTKKMNAFRDTYIDPKIKIAGLQYIFIDSRSGIADESFVTLGLSDKYVIVFSRLDNQSQTSTINFLKLLKETKFRNIKPIIVLSSIPSGNVLWKIDNYEYRISERAGAVLEKMNVALKELDLGIHCLLPFDESFLIEHKIITSDEHEYPISIGFNHLADIIISLQEEAL
jgi:MinD-like ATPase involved in chromosome partitioning or flagellar assembly